MICDVPHERVSVDARIDEFDQLLLDDISLGPELFDRLREAQRKLGLLHGDRPTCPFLRPHVLHRAQYATTRCVGVSKKRVRVRRSPLAKPLQEELSDKI